MTIKSFIEEVLDATPPGATISFDIGVKSYYGQVFVDEKSATRIQFTTKKPKSSA